MIVYPTGNGRFVLPWDYSVFKAHADLAAKYDIVERRPVFKDGRLSAVIVIVRPKKT